MKIHYFIGNWDFIVGVMRLEDSDLVHQLNNVLKLHINEKIFLGDGKGCRAEAVIKNIDKKSVVVEIVEIKSVAPSKRKVNLFCSVLKRENFEWIVEKTTETGVNEIIPLITERTVKHDLNLVRLQKIAKEAAEQSGRFFVPSVLSPLRLDEALKIYGDKFSNLLCNFGGSELKNIKTNSQIGIWVGPEGGWSEEELEEINDFKFKIVSLGENILRAETAAVVGVWAASNI